MRDNFDGPFAFFEKEADHNAYQGPKGQFTFDFETCTLRVQDGCCCPGKFIISGLAFAKIAELCERVEVLEAKPDLAVSDFTIVDGTATITMNDGSSFAIEIELPEDEEGTYITDAAPVIDIAGQTVTFETAEDEGEAPGTLVWDLSSLFTALTSPAGPSFVGNAVSYNPATNTYTITDTDTDTFATWDGSSVITLANGDEIDLNDFAADTDVSNLDATITNAGIQLSVTEDGVTINAPLIPFASVLTCNLSETQTIVTPKFMSDWLDRGYEFDSATITDFTNICDNTVQSSVQGTAGPTRASAIAVNQSDATGVQATVISTTFGDATGTGNSMRAVSGTPAFRALIQGFYGSMTSVRVGGNNVASGTPSLINQGWSNGTATFSPLIGRDTAALYSYILGGGDNWTEFNYSGVISGLRCKANNVRALTSAASDSTNDGATSQLTASEYTINPDNFVLVGGSGAAPASTSNRTWSIDSLSGTGSFAAGVVAGAVFPGIGECCLGEFDAGAFIRFAKGNTAVEVKTRQEAEAVVIGRVPAICAGGMYDPANAPYIFDANGAIETIDFNDDTQVVEAKAVMEATEEMKSSVDAVELSVRAAYSVLVKTDEDVKSKTNKKAEMVLTASGKVKMKAVEEMREQLAAYVAMAEKQVKEAKVIVRKRLVKNKKFDAAKHAETKFSSFEFVGRPLVPNPNGLTVDDFYGPKGAKADEKSGYRIIDVVGDAVQIVVK